MVFAIRVQDFVSVTSVAVQVYKVKGNCPGIVNLLIVVERSGFVKHLDPVMESEVKAKTMTSLLIIPALLVKVQI